MKKICTLSLAAASLLTLGVVSSCKDYNEDFYNDVNKTILDERNSLLENLKAQGYNLEEMLNRIKELEASVCNCGDVDQKIAAYFDTPEAKEKILAIIEAAGYVKNTALLEFIKAEDLQGLVRMEDLKEYLKQTDLEGYLKLEDLDGYVKLSDLEGYIKIEDLAGFVKAEDLADFIKASDLEEAIRNAVTKDFIEKLIGENSSISEAEIKALVDQYLDSKDFSNCAINCAARLDALEKAQLELQNQITIINETLAKQNNTITEIYNLLMGSDEAMSFAEALAKIGALEEDVKDLKATTATQGSQITSILAEIAKLKAQTGYDGTWNQAWNSTVKSIANKLIADSIAKVNADIAEKVSALNDAIAAAKKEANDYTDAAIKEALKGLEGKYLTADDLEDYMTLKDVTTLIEDAEKKLQQEINGVKSSVTTLQSQVDAINTKLNDLTGRMDDLYNRLNAQITSIVIQGAASPLTFNSTMALPIGLQSNILCGYYGENTTGVRKFPSTNTMGVVEASLDNFKAEDLEGVQVLDLRADGVSDFASTGGKLYFTVNPSNCDFSKSLEGRTIYLYDSKNNTSAYVLRNVKASDKLLEFGMPTISTRAAENGFYEADAVIDFENGKEGADAKLNVSLEDVKEVGKDLLSFMKTKQGVKDLVTSTLSLALNAQSMPAYALGIPYSYKENGVQNTAYVFSNYNIAATSIKPLSFSFAEGMNDKFPARLQRHIPFLSTLREKINNKVKQIEQIVHFDFREANLNIDGFDCKLSINITDILLEAITTTVNANGITAINVPIEVDYTYEVPNFDASGKFDGTYSIKPGHTTIKIDLLDQEVDIESSTAVQVTAVATEIHDKIVASINQTLGDYNDLLEKNMKDVIASISDQMTTLFQLTEDDVNGQAQKVFDIIDAMLGRGDRVFSIADKFISRINNILDRVYKVANTPNHYVQPIMLIGNDNIGMTSTTPVLPTVVRATEAGKNYGVIYPTTYTADLLNPAYKKFVKVTKVYGGLDWQCKKAMSDANAATNMNKVIDGNVRAIEFITDQEYAGLTYEITYAAIDYSGYQSIQRYYIKVVK